MKQLLISTTKARHLVLHLYITATGLTSWSQCNQTRGWTLFLVLARWRPGITSTHTQLTPSSWTCLGLIWECVSYKESSTSCFTVSKWPPPTFLSLCRLISAPCLQLSAVLNYGMSKIHCKTVISKMTALWDTPLILCQNQFGHWDYYWAHVM